MIYDVTHITRYRYASAVAANSGVLRLTPKSENGQTVASSGIEVTPAPLALAERIDSFGNRALHMRIEKPHRELLVKATCRVNVHRPAPPMAALTPPWEEVAAAAAATHSLHADSPALALYPSRLVSLFPAARDYARQSFPPRRPVYEAARELTARIKADFAYDPKATDIDTTPEQAFAGKRGVCQDFAHIMIAALRGLGLPALYVSGYIRTFPPAGEKRLVGADASHAWVSLWCGPGAGWLGLDPTNAIPEGDDHIVLARGRDYADASPMEGVIVSSGGQKLDVEVDVAPVGRPAP